MDNKDQMIKQMYEIYKNDKNKLDKSWIDYFESSNTPDNIQIIQGPKGPKGDKGDTGLSIQGPRGKTVKYNMSFSKNDDLILNLNSDLDETSKIIVKKSENIKFNFIKQNEIQIVNSNIFKTTQFFDFNQKNKKYKPDELINSIIIRSNENKSNDILPNATDIIQKINNPTLNLSFEFNIKCSNDLILNCNDGLEIMNFNNINQKNSITLKPNKLHNFLIKLVNLNNPQFMIYYLGFKHFE